jgi:hypothetical protein
MRIFTFAVILSLFFTDSAVAQTSIDSSMAVNIGGIKQWINISTKDASKPLLLYLGGGPGESNIAGKDYFTGKLQEQTPRQQKAKLRLRNCRLSGFHLKTRMICIINENGYLLTSITRYLIQC